jgi:AcrR family transcriptional regulator
MGAQPEFSALDRRVVDAATDLARAYGDRRMTIEDVAARSGVSRATIFRRFGSKDRLVATVHMLEMRRAVDALDSTARNAQTPADLAVDLFVGLLSVARRNAQVQRLVEFDRDRILDVATDGDPCPLDVCRQFVADRFRDWQRRGRLKGRDADELADFLVHLAFSYVLAPSSVCGGRDMRRLKSFAQLTIAPAFT